MNNSFNFAMTYYRDKDGKHNVEANYFDSNGVDETVSASGDTADTAIRNMTYKMLKQVSDKKNAAKKERKPKAIEDMTREELIDYCHKLTNDNKPEKAAPKKEEKPRRPTSFFDFFGF